MKFSFGWNRLIIIFFQNQIAKSKDWNAKLKKYDKVIKKMHLKVSI